MLVPGARGGAWAGAWRGAWNTESSYALSCNHVFAAVNAARPGDPIVQPSVLDGGNPYGDVVGHFVRAAPIVFSGALANVADAALAVLPERVTSATILGVGEPRGVRRQAAVRPGELVSKSGRATGVTVGVVVAVNCDIWVDYLDMSGRLLPALFEEQIVTTVVCGYGDSGSVLLDTRRNVAGILFAGTPTNALFNPIGRVEVALDFQIPLPSAG
jgi:hypothetical protein